MAASIHDRFRVLELYSGIGGMHWSLKESGISYEIVMAVDINTTANKIYQHNFPDVNLLSFGIEKLTLKKLQALKIDAILMSPPCQPFTRVGNKQDCDDIRTKSFLHLLDLIQRLEVKPQYLLVENVKGFETSKTRSLLMQCLASCGYNHQEFLLTPLQFGVPNCRLRYYLVARWRTSFSFPVAPRILKTMPCNDTSTPHEKTQKCESALNSDSNQSNTNNNYQSSSDPNTAYKTDCAISTHPPKKQKTNSPSPSQPLSLSCSPSNTALTNEENQAGFPSCTSNTLIKQDENRSEDSQQISNPVNQNSNLDQHEINLRDAGRNMRYCEEEDILIGAHSKPLSEYMEMESTEEELKQYLLSDKELRFFVVMDIVFPGLKKSICFTKRYGHYVEGAGSVVQMSTDVEVTRAASEFKSQAVELQNSRDWAEKELGLLRQLRLRYFTPREVANLLCFPPQMTFPEDISTIQKYRVLGNSLNVHVVASLIKLMVS